MPMPAGIWGNPQVNGQWNVEHSQNWLFANRRRGVYQHGFQVCRPQKYRAEYHLKDSIRTDFSCAKIWWVFPVILKPLTPSCTGVSGPPPALCQMVPNVWASKRNAHVQELGHIGIQPFMVIFQQVRVVSCIFSLDLVTLMHLYVEESSK